MAKHPFVIVEWSDAWADATMVVTDEDALKKNKPLVVRTRGFLLSDTSEGVLVAAEDFPDVPGEYRGPTMVPRAMIKSVTHVRLTPIKIKASPSQNTVPPST